MDVTTAKPACGTSVNCSTTNLSAGEPTTSLQTNQEPQPHRSLTPRANISHQWGRSRSPSRLRPVRGRPRFPRPGQVPWGGKLSSVVAATPVGLCPIVVDGLTRDVTPGAQYGAKTDRLHTLRDLNGLAREGRNLLADS